MANFKTAGQKKEGSSAKEKGCSLFSEKGEGSTQKGPFFLF